MKEIKEKDMVRVGHLVLVVEEIEGSYFFGSDEDGGEHECRLRDVDAIL
ncbi:hypothetical protein N9955_00600 [bacterium]|nr:hypothetical protein [bacterium]